MPLPFRSGNGQVAQIRYSLERNQPAACRRTVTTVWRTELGTTLPRGFNNTTAVSAYFRCLSFCYFAPNRPPQFLSGMDTRSGQLAPYGRGSFPSCGHRKRLSPDLLRKCDLDSRATNHLIRRRSPADP